MSSELSCVYTGRNWCWFYHFHEDFCGFCIWFSHTTSKLAQRILPSPCELFHIFVHLTAIRIHGYFQDRTSVHKRDLLDSTISSYLDINKNCQWIFEIFHCVNKPYADLLLCKSIEIVPSRKLFSYPRVLQHITHPTTWQITVLSNVVCCFVLSIMPLCLLLTWKQAGFFLIGTNRKVKFTSSSCFLITLYLLFSYLWLSTSNLIPFLDIIGVRCHFTWPVSLSSSDAKLFYSICISEAVWCSDFHFHTFIHFTNFCFPVVLVVFISEKMKQNFH